MLPKKHKITRETFPKHTEKRSKWVGGCLSIQYITQRERESSPVFTVVVPKKVLAFATKRNKLKRVIYDVISVHMPIFTQSGLTKLIITPLKNTHTPDRATINTDVMRFLSSL